MIFQSFIATFYPKVKESFEVSRVGGSIGSLCPRGGIFCLPQNNTVSTIECNIRLFASTCLASAVFSC